MTGQITAGQVLGNAGATLGLPTGTGLSPLFDRAFGAPSQQGTVLNRRESTWSATAVPVFGLPGTTRGTLGLAGLTSGTVTVRTKDVAGTWTMTLPDTGGTNNFVLTTDGAGITSWSNPAAGGTVTSVALVAPGEFTVSGSPVTIAGTLTFAKATQSANAVWAGPTTGAAAQPAFRALVGADLPNPGASSLGGIQSTAGTSHQWIASISTLGVPSLSQPAFTDISGTVAAAQLPNPSASTLGGIQSFALQASKWISSISTSGVPSATQPAFGDLSGSLAQAQLPIAGNNTVIANTSGGSTFPVPTAPTAILDIIASTQGDILYRNAAAWVALAPGTNGQVLTTSGAAANPTWTTVTGTGTVTSVASGTGLTGGPVTTTGTLALANIANNKVMANVSGGSAAPIANDPTSILDIIGATEGQILYRGASVWTALAPGTNGQVLQTQGAGSTPQWANAGSVSSVGSGTGLTGGPITGSGTLAVSLSSLTNSLSGDVVLNNTASFFDGPSVAQGASGTWLVTGTITVQDTSSAANFQAKLWDGTTVIAAAATITGAINAQQSISLSGIITSPAGNLRISAKDASTTSGLIKFNSTGTSKDSTITAIRIA